MRLSPSTLHDPFQYSARTDRRAQCFGLNKFNLHLRNNVRKADIYTCIIIYKKSTVRLASVGLTQAHPKYYILAIALIICVQLSSQHPDERLEE